MTTEAQSGPKRVKVGLYVGIGTLGVGLISMQQGLHFGTSCCVDEILFTESLWHGITRCSSRMLHR
jgi:hypothetical protein